MTDYGWIYLCLLHFGWGFYSLRRTMASFPENSWAFNLMAFTLNCVLAPVAMVVAASLEKRKDVD